MASAPKVKKGGHEAAKSRKAKAREVYRISVADTDVSFTHAPNNVPIRVRSLVRDLFGMSLDQWLFGRGAVDVQTYADIWWISRLSAGENVTRDEVHDEWDERCPGVTKHDIDDHQIAGVDEDGNVFDEEADDPKA
jgi:hypothetical protein